MRRLVPCALAHPPRLTSKPLAVPARLQSSLRDTPPFAASSSKDAARTDGEVTSSFPGDRAAQLPPSRRRRGTGEVDALLTDVLTLGKRVADEQQRHRVSIPASQLVSLRPPPRGGPATAEAAAKPTEPPISPPPRQNASVRLRRAAAPSRPPPPAPHTTAPPPRQSWTPSLVLPREQLRATAAAHTASDIAFTLEELENTLFSPEADAARDGDVDGVPHVATATATEASAAPAPEHPEAAAPPPTPPLPPPVPEAMPSGAAPASPPLTRPVDASPARGTNATPSPVTATAQSSPAAAPPTVASPPVPVVRCRLRGAAVVVQVTRASPAPRALLEALQEAVSFAESLPPLSEGPREVRLGLAESATSDGATHVFVEADGWVEVTSSGEERAAVQLLKDRLLRRLVEGPARGLRYVAELRVGGDVGGDIHGQAMAPLPLVVRDTAAELLLACTALDLRHRERPNAGVDASAVRLSFSGIAVGVFPAPATVQRVTRVVRAACASDGGREALCVPHLGAAASATPSELVAALMPQLHQLPHTASSALLAGCVGALNGSSAAPTLGAANTASPHWAATLRETARGWWSRVAQACGVGKASPAASSTACAAAPAACVTATDVWRALCAATAAAHLTEDAVWQAINTAAHAAPVWRCAQSYRRVTAPARVDSGAAPALPLVVNVTAAALQRASVADLASEVREQPSDVVLVLAESVRLQQKLQFLASLHLTDTGSHHCVTVLLPGDPGTLAECASLTASSACLTPQLPCGGRCGAAVPLYSDAHWLQHLVEVSTATTGAARATSATATVGEGSTPVALAEAYVTQTWRRPCVATASGTVGLAMSAAVAVAWQRLAAPGTAAIAQPMRRRREFQQTHLAPLVLSSAGSGTDTGAAWWTATALSAPADSEDGAAQLASVPALMKRLGAAWPASPPPLRASTSAQGGAAGCGVAFLFALDAACQCLQRRRVASPEVLNALSVAALGLDPSAGGILTVADRLAGGDGVDEIVAAMEDAAAVQGINFATLPLLRWMAGERLLLYQLTTAVFDRFASAQPPETA